MSDTSRTAVGVDQRGVPPKLTSDLQLIPEAWRQYYQRAMDGSGFKLVGIPAGDEKAFVTYAEEIKRGEIVAYDEGDAPGAPTAAERERAERQKIFKAELEKLEAEQKARDLARLDAHMAQRRSEWEQEFERRKSSYR
jgi:hypothetical protein